MSDAIYANARAITAENSLLGLDRLLRMADSRNVAEAVRVLSEVNFGEGAPIESADDYETLIDAEEKKFYAFLKEVSPDKSLTRFFTLRNDYHNAEAFMRAKYLKTDPKLMLTTEGLISFETLKESISVDEYGKFSLELAEALLAADNLFVAGKADGLSLSAVFRKSLYKELAKAAKPVKHLGHIFSVKADAVNIGVALRTRNYAAADEMFVAGGTLGKDLLKCLCEETPENLKEKFKYSHLADLICSALESAAKNSPLTEFERISDGYALTYLKKEKYDDSGCKPFLLYCFYKLSELANVRIIISCLSNGIDSAEIKRRVREGYEG